MVNKEDPFRYIVREVMELSPAEMREFLRSTKHYGKDEIPTTPPWMHFDRTGYSPQIVRRGYQRDWDLWVLRHPEHRDLREIWMGKAYLMDEDPYEPSTWIANQALISKLVDDAFYRKPGESMRGPPWSNPPGYAWMLEKPAWVKRRTTRVRPHVRRRR